MDYGTDCGNPECQVCSDRYTKLKGGGQSVKQVIEKMIHSGANPADVTRIKRTQGR